MRLQVGFARPRRVAPLNPRHGIPEDQRQLISAPRFYENVNRRDDSPPIVVLDEIHKYPQWKDYLKGAYDRDAGRYRFLVLSSGRLDLRQKGGDSLAGRYLLFHLWPFTLAELCGVRRPLAEFLAEPGAIDTADARHRRATWDALMRWSGFPEPFLKSSDEFHQLWSRAYGRELVREDVLSLVHVQKVAQIELLLSLLPERVGSPLSLNQLAGALAVSHDSVRSWLGVLDDFFLTFRIAPWTRKLARSLLKERKLYLMNAALVPDPGARFENQVALELRRAVSRWNDLGKGEFSLHYVRTKDGEEVDFLLARGQGTVPPHRGQVGRGGRLARRPQVPTSPAPACHSARPPAGRVQTSRRSRSPARHRLGRSLAAPPAVSGRGMTEGRQGRSFRCGLDRLAYQHVRTLQG